MKNFIGAVLMAACLAAPAQAQLVRSGSVVSDPGVVVVTGADGRPITVPVTTLIDPATGLPYRAEKGGDASAVNQQSQLSAEQLISTRLGDIASPAAGTVNARLDALAAKIDALTAAATGPTPAGTSYIGQFGGSQTAGSPLTGGLIGLCLRDTSGLCQAVPGNAFGAFVQGAGPAGSPAVGNPLRVGFTDLSGNAQTWRGSSATNGAYVVERERAKYFAETTAVLAAGAPAVGAWQDAGPSPSQYGSFTCFWRSDAASAASGALIQASATSDGTGVVTEYSTTLNANAPAFYSVKVMMRYHRCQLVNGSTPTTAAPVINSSLGN